MRIQRDTRKWKVRRRVKKKRIGTKKTMGTMRLQGMMGLQVGQGEKRNVPQRGYLTTQRRTDK